MKRKQPEINYDELSEEELEELMRKEEQEYYEHLASLGKITYKRQTIANKQHFCSVCGCEIHKGEMCWWWKPYPLKRNGKVRWFKWRTNCWDHEPMRYNEDEFDADVCEGSFQNNGYGNF